jgi:hypothetical protein
MEFIVGIAVIALVAYVLTRKKDQVEANQEAPIEQPVPAGDVAPQPEPVPEEVVVAVEGAGVVEVPAVVEEAVKPAKKPRAKKAKAE